MEIIKAYKYRLIPSEEQLDIIKRTCGCARIVYNMLLSDTINKLENKEAPSINKVTELYEKAPFLKGMDSLALANARINIQNSFNNFYKSCKGKRKGKKLGFPKFKKKSICKESYTTNNQGGSIRIKDNLIKLPKIGFIKLKYHTPIKGLIKSATITVNKDNTVEISIIVIENVKPIIKQINNIKDLKIIGLDMSMSAFYVSSDGEKPNFDRLYRNSEKKRRRLNKSLHRKKLIGTGEFKYNKKFKKNVEIKKPSKNREKARVKLAKLGMKVSNQRKDFAHKLSRKLVDNNDVIVLEDINLQAMSQCLKLGKSVNDLGFGQFRTFLEYKSILSDTLVIKVPKFFASSKTCSECGYKNTDLKLKDREWVCPECGVINDRDLNAAYNLRNYFITNLNTVGTTEIKACGDGTSGLRETLIKVLSVKQEGNTVKFTARSPLL